MRGKIEGNNLMWEKAFPGIGKGRLWILREISGSKDSKGNPRVAGWVWQREGKYEAGYPDEIFDFDEGSAAIIGRYDGLEEAKKAVENKVGYLFNPKLVGSLCVLGTYQQRFKKRRQQSFSPFSNIMNKLEKRQIQRKLFLRNTSARPQPGAR